MRDNGISNIHGRAVSSDIQYSAKKPEIISGLQADYGYSEASANNIYKAAQTLKQNTGSKADVEQLTAAIATSLENRRSGEIDSDNINRIAMMLAESAESVNDSYVSEYKPIMDYLKGAKISISEADISDLGDAFSYVKKRLFPQVTLAKEAVINNIRIYRSETLSHCSLGVLRTALCFLLFSTHSIRHRRREPAKQLTAVRLPKHSIRVRYLF